MSAPGDTGGNGVILGTIVNPAGLTLAKTVPASGAGRFTDPGLGASPTWHGFAIDRVGIAFTDDISVVGDQRVRIDADGLRIIGDGLAWAPASFFDQDGNPVPACTRGTLARIESRLTQAGLRAQVGHEIEFLLVDPAGKRLPGELRYVPGDTTWTNALAQSASQTAYGATGYLVTITNAEENNFIVDYVNAQNVWIGASDQGTEGTWKWMAGPEAGITFWVGNGSGSTVPPLNYASWASGEPNEGGVAGEDYAVTNWQGSFGLWNDLADDPSQTIGGYIAEFSEPIGGYTGVFSQREVSNVI